MPDAERVVAALGRLLPAWNRVRVFEPALADLLSSRPASSLTLMAAAFALWCASARVAVLETLRARLGRRSLARGPGAGRSPGRGGPPRHPRFPEPESAMESLAQDVRFAARALRARPLFSAVVVTILALGVGANAAMFAFFDSVVLRPLPFAEPGRLVSLTETDRDSSNPDASVTAAGFQDWRAQASSFESMVAFRRTSFSLTGTEVPESLSGLWVSSDLFELLGVPPVHGRGFLPPDERRGPEVVISHEVWTGRFGADPAILERPIRLDGVVHRIVGVAPPGLEFGGGVAQLLVAAGRDVPPPPIDLGEDYLTDRGIGYLDVIGRLASDATLEQAAEEMRAIQAAISEAFPEEQGDRGVSIRPLHSILVESVRAPLTGLVGAVGFVLLIACSNIASLMLARAAARHGEMSLRVALGAPRGRLFRQLLFESSLLSAIGGLAGVAFAFLGLELLRGFLPPDVPRAAAISIDPGVLAFGVALAAASAILCGWLPALQLSRPDLRAGLTATRGAAAAGMSHRTRGGLVVAEIAVALVLVVGAGLMLKSFVRLATAEPGFDPENVLAVSVALAEERFPDSEQVHEFYSRSLAQMRAIPGVSSAGLVLALPFSGSAARVSFYLEDQGPENAEGRQAIFQTASPGYFETLRIPLRRGRLFDDRDGDGAGVIIVNEELVRRHVPADRDPLTLTLNFGDEDEYRVVGVVGNVRHDGYAEPFKPEVYMPVAQLPWRVATFMLRTESDPALLAAAAARAIAAVDPDQPAQRTRPLAEVLAGSLGQPRLLATMLAAFAAVALGLAALGIFGLVSHIVGGRVGEFGLRMALGARRGDVGRLVLRDVGRLLLFGVALGTAGSVGISRLIASLLHDVSPLDLSVYAAGAGALLVAALGAALVPTMRATRVDPAVALRSP